MEQIQISMRENQGKKSALRDMRAMERQRKMPQNLQSTELEYSDEREHRGGGAAGLARVVGRGRKCGGGKRGASVSSSDSSDSGEGGARHMGRMMYEHLSKMHGKGYADKFMGVGGAAPRNLPPMGGEVLHARMTPARVGLPGSGLGGQDVPPGGMAPVAYGSAPQAPASFQRNSVDVGSAGLLPLPSAQVGSGRRKAAKQPPSVHMTLLEDDDHAGGRASLHKVGVYKGPDAVMRESPTAAVSGGKRAARGQAISKLMKEKGLSLPEASRYLKEHGMK